MDTNPDPNAPQKPSILGSITQLTTAVGNAASDVFEGAKKTITSVDVAGAAKSVGSAASELANSAFSTVSKAAESVTTDSTFDDDFRAIVQKHRAKGLKDSAIRQQITTLTDELL